MKLITTVSIILLVCGMVVPLGAVHAATGLGLSLNISGICNHPGGAGAPDCNFDDFVHLAKVLIDFMILLSIPLATIAFAYAGVLFLTAGGSEGQAGKAKEIFVKVLWGFLFVLTAWILVHTITSAILNKDNYYNPLSVAALVSDC